MPDVLTYLRSLLGLTPRRETIHRTVAHPRLGALRFVGWRRPNEPVAGHWEVTPPGTARAITVDLGSAADGTPLPGDVAWLEAFLSDLDGFYALIRPALAPEYAHWVGGEPPANWRMAFRLDSVMPPGYDDEAPDDWQVSYWRSLISSIAIDSARRMAPLVRSSIDLLPSSWAGVRAITGTRGL